jgi:hypothetical protein
MDHATNKTRYVWYALLFMIIWVSTFNAAYVNGDDVVYMSGLQTRQILLFQLHKAWIPNRVLSSYSLTLSTAIFDFFYYPAKYAFNIDFYVAYKIFAATLFALFLLWVYSYIVKNVNFPEKIGPNTAYDHVQQLFVAILVLSTFPWKNQVHLICYQFSAFLSFVLLNELKKIFINLYKNPSDDSPIENSAKWRNHLILILLSYVCAFSLETNTMIIWFVIVVSWGVILIGGIWLKDKGCQRISMGQSRGSVFFANLSLVAVMFCSLAVLITIFFSERATVIDKDVQWMDILREIFSDNMHLWLFLAGMLMIIVLVCIEVKICYQRWINSNSELAARLKSKTYSGLDVKMCFIFTAIVCFSSFTAVLLVSMISGNNYFSHIYYPWGGLLLIGKLACIYLIAFLLLRIRSASLIFLGLVVLVVVIASSKYGLAFLSTSQAKYQQSRLVEAAYREAITSRSNLIETGLGLDQIPMQLRPLPTENSPEGFKKDYKNMFLKYYDVAEIPLFR